MYEMHDIPYLEQMGSKPSPITQIDRVCLFIVSRLVGLRAVIRQTVRNSCEILGYRGDGTIDAFEQY